MWTKRLEKGLFRPPRPASADLVANVIEAAELALILEGIDLEGRVAARAGSRRKMCRVC
jgi:hypothetical protein